jgi:hypothetical protein
MVLKMSKMWNVCQEKPEAVSKASPRESAWTTNSKTVVVVTLNSIGPHILPPYAQMKDMSYKT